MTDGTRGWRRRWSEFGEEIIQLSHRPGAAESNGNGRSMDSLLDPAFGERSGLWRCALMGFGCLGNETRWL